MLGSIFGNNLTATGSRNSMKGMIRNTTNGTSLKRSATVLRNYTKQTEYCISIFGIVWYDVIWCHVIWCHVMYLVWCGVVWCGVVWCGVVWYDCVAWCGVMCCGMVFKKGNPHICESLRGVVQKKFWGLLFESWIHL